MAPKRILIIDDERLTRISLADFLEEMGYDTATASDGEAGLQLYREHPFDICIVDIRMPNLDGVETIRALHRIAPTCHFIVYTGSPRFTLPPALEQLGITEHHIIRKPVIDMNIFVELIDQLIASDKAGSGGLAHDQRN